MKRPEIFLVALVMLDAAIDACATTCIYTPTIPMPKQETIQVARDQSGHECSFRARLAAYVRLRDDGQDKYIDLSDGYSVVECSQEKYLDKVLFYIITISHICGVLTFNVRPGEPDALWRLDRMFLEIPTSSYDAKAESKDLSSYEIGPSHLNHSYRCRSMQRIGVGPFELVLHDLTLAFSEAKEDRDFHKSQDQCLQDREWCAILDDKPEPHLRRVAVHSDGAICIIAELSAYIKIAEGTTKFIELIDAHDVRGTCPGRGDAGTFVVNYRCATLTFHVSREDAQSPMEVVQVDAEVLSPQFGLNQTKDLGYKTKRAGQSYNCQPEQEITLGYSEAAGGIVSLALSQMVVEAFRLEMAPAPYQPKYFCRADSRVCLPVHAKPMPYIRRAKLENRRGPDEGKICIIAELSAYAQIGDDRYIELDIDAFGAMDSQCPQELGIANAATLSFSTPCGDFTLLINREDERSPMQIAGVLLERTESRLRLPPTVKRLDGFGAKSADHAYRCESERRVVLRQASEGAESVSLVVSNMSIEAFRTGDSADYYQPQDSCQQDNLNKLCRPDLVKSEPILSTAQAQRAGNGTGICARATLKAYFRIGRDKYVGLKDAAGGGRCQEANTGAVVTFTSDCGSLSL